MEPDCGCPKVEGVLKFILADPVSSFLKSQYIPNITAFAQMSMYPKYHSLRTSLSVPSFERLCVGCARVVADEATAAHLQIPVVLHVCCNGCSICCSSASDPESCKCALGGVWLEFGFVFAHIACGNSFSLNLQSQSHGFLFYETWNRRSREEIDDWELTMKNDTASATGCTYVCSGRVWCVLTHTGGVWWVRHDLLCLIQAESGLSSASSNWLISVHSTHWKCIDMCQYTCVYMYTRVYVCVYVNSNWLISVHSTHWKFIDMCQYTCVYM